MAVSRSPGVRGVGVRPHRDGHLDRQGQDLEILRTEPLPPHLKGVLPEPGRLGMAAAQLQPPHLVDDEAAQRRIAGVQEAAIGLEVLQRQVVGGVVGGPVRVTRVRLGQQGVRGRPVRQERVVPVLLQLSPRHGLDDPVHLDLVTGPVHLDQGQPVHLAGCGAEPRRG